MEKTKNTMEFKKNKYDALRGTPTFMSKVQDIVVDMLNAIWDSVDEKRLEKRAGDLVALKLLRPIPLGNMRVREIIRDGKDIYHFSDGKEPQSLFIGDINMEDCSNVIWHLDYEFKTL